MALAVVFDEVSEIVRQAGPARARRAVVDRFVGQVDVAVPAVVFEEVPAPGARRVRVASAVDLDLLSYRHILDDHSLGYFKHTTCLDDMVQRICCWRPCASVVGGVGRDAAPRVVVAVALNHRYRLHRRLPLLSWPAVPVVR